MVDLDALLNLEMRVDGRLMQLKLKPPSFLWSIAHISDPRFSVAADVARQTRIFEMWDWIESVNGELRGQEHWRILENSQELVDALRRARTKFYGHVREEGRVLVGCPNCQREAEISFLALVVGTGADPWPITNRAGDLGPPSFSFGLVTTPRPAGVACASTLRLLLPSRRVGLPSPLAELKLSATDVTRVNALASQWELDVAVAPPERAHWSRSCVAFRAAIHLLDATRTSDSLRDPSQVDALPAVDFLFADVVYYMMFASPIRARVEASLVECLGCGGAFSVFGQA